MERIRISWRQTVTVTAALVLAFGLAGCEMITGALNGGDGGGNKAEPVLTVSLPNVSISVGTFKSIKVTAKDKSGNIEWFTADSTADATAIVQNQTASGFDIKGVAPGTATIVVTSASNKTVSIAVTVAAVAAAAPLTPAALAASNPTSSTVDLTWTSTGDATTWDVQKATGTGTSVVWSAAASALTIPAYTVTGLVPNTDYQFRVKANNSSGSSAWTTGVPAKTTAITQVTTITGKPTVSLGLVTSSSVQIQWTGVPGATKYEVQSVSSTGGYLATVIDNFNGLNFNVSGLASNTDYSYQVRGKNDIGGAGPWSTTFTARTSVVQTGGSAPTTAPVLTVGLIGADYVQVKWTSVASATNYDLYYGYASNGTMVWVGPYTFGSQLVDTTLTSLTASTTYSFKMVAWNGQGQGPASVVKTATTTAPVTQPTNTPPLAPSGLVATVTAGLSGPQAYLTWYASYGALGYNVYRLDPGAVTYTYVGWTDQYSTYFQDPANLLPGKQYQYKVNAFNASPLASPDSNIASVFTPNTSSGTGPAAPNAYSYSSGGIDYYEVDWNLDPMVVRYDVEVSTDGVNWNLFATTNYAYVYYYGPSGGMLNDKTYQFRVKAYDSQGRFSLSNVLTYRTPAASTPVTAVIHIN